MAKSVIDVKILGDNKGLSSALTDSESKIGKFAKVAAGIGVGIAAGAAVAGAALFKIGSDFDEQFDKIRVGTGATGDALIGLEDSFKNVLGNVPASFEDVGTAIADLNTRLGLTGKPLEDLSAQMLNLSRLTKTDLATNVDQITRVFGDWGIGVDDQADSMDNLYRAAQASGIGINDLSGSVVQFGAPLRNLGFGFDESLALLAQFNKTGVNTETVFAGLKAGVGKLAKAGEDVPTTFKRIVEEITNLGPGSEATGLAIELFGQRAGPDLADAITGGKFALDDMMAAITDGTDTINGAAKDTESFGEKWTLIKNRVLVALEPVATKVFAAIGTAMDKLGPKIETLVAWLQDNIPKAVDAIQKAWRRYGQPVMDAMIEAFDAVVGWVQDHWPEIKKIAETVFEGIATAAGSVVAFFKDAWPVVQTAISAVFDWITTHKDEVIGALVALAVVAGGVLVAAFVSWAAAATAAGIATLVAIAPFVAIGVAIAAIGAALVWAYQNVEWFREAVDTVAAFFVDTVWPILQDTAAVVVEVVGGIVDFIRENWDTIQTIIVTVFEYVRDFITDIWDAISLIVDGAMSYIQGVIDVVMGLISGDWGRVWDGIKSMVTGVWDAIKGVVDLAMAYVGRVIDIALAAVKLAWETVWNGVSSFISDTWDDITGFVETGVQGVIDFVTGLPSAIFDAVTGAFDVIWDEFKGVLNKIINAWNNLSFTLPSVTVDWNGPLPGGELTVGGWTISTPNLPEFHSGGVVPGPVGSELLAVLQAGERILPIDQADASSMTAAEMRKAIADGMIDATRRIEQQRRAA